MFIKWFIIIVEVGLKAACVESTFFLLVTKSVSYYLVNTLKILSILSVYGEQKWFSHKTVPCSEKCRKYDCITWYKHKPIIHLTPFLYLVALFRGTYLLYRHKV